MWGFMSSDRDADTNHPLGYGKNAYFWSFIVALVLFTLGGVYSAYEGLHKMAHPEPLKFVGWAVAILAFGFVMELRSFRICVAEIRERHPGKSLWWCFRETREPELLIIFGEDLAALIGLGLAAVFLLIAAATGNPWWDALGSVVVGVLLMVVAGFLFMETKALLIGQSVDPQTRRTLRQLLVDSDLIEHTYQMITMQMGRDAVLLLRVRMRERDHVEQLLADINELERQIITELPQFTEIFIEPDNQFVDF